MARVVPLSTKLKIYTVSVVVLLLLVLSGYAIEFDPLAFLEGIPNGLAFFLSLLRPDASYIPHVFNKLVETIKMAIIGTTIASLIAIPYSFLASMITTPNRLVYVLSRLIMNVLRTIPDIVLAAVFVAIFGIGALPGILAIAFFSFGVMTKLMSEDVDAVDVGPIEASVASGANRIQTIVFAVVPQVLPNFVSYILYTFEVNVRVSIVLGLVGAGGIGQILIENLRLFQYDKVSLIVLITFVAVILIDTASEEIRKRLV